VGDPLSQNVSLQARYIQIDVPQGRLAKGDDMADDNDKAREIIMPEAVLPVSKGLLAGAQHVIAMFGATALAPILMGFDPNVCLLASGVATILFFLIVGGKIPSYLGSSFSFIAVVIAVTGYTGQGINPNISVALGGIIGAGVLYAIIGLLVIIFGYSWIRTLMPDVLTGSIVAVIGLNLAPVAVSSISGSEFDVWCGVLAIVAVCVASVYAPGFLGRLPIFIGGGVSYLIYYIYCNVFELGGTPIDFSRFHESPWLGVPNFTAPTFELSAILSIAPVAFILVAENLGHVKAVSASISRNLDDYLGRAFVGDGVATVLSGCVGGTGVTTYAENIGVMGVTRNYSSATFVIAGCFAIVFGFSPAFGALLLTIPAPILGGLSFVLFGLITATAGRIWVDANVDFTLPRNLLTVGVTLVIGSGNLSLQVWNFSIGGIATAMIASLILYHSLRK